ncbi:DUF222 domain-containing protein [Rhodococcus spelaei]|uniref:DUF222 domain-containing protein n=2 Tax=Rhodococcus spelaei TaxID=2546320 RepID=A0A541B803_9NOCA|nr:DUF222 domain-containing protein [Rhodococcus spelaei]
MEQHLAALDAAVEGLLTDGVSGLSDADVVETLQRMETSLRKAAAVGHRLIAEAVQRSLPSRLDCKSINDLLIKSLRISAADATQRAKGADSVGIWRNLNGATLPETLPATAQAVREGAVGPDHVTSVAKVIRKVPATVARDKAEVAERILAELARSSTPEDVKKVGANLIAHLDPDGNAPDERERARRRGLRMGKQDEDLMTPISGLLDPETRALLEPLLAKLARPGMNNPDDPGSPAGDVDSPTLDRDALAKAAARDTRTVAQRNHDALRVSLRHLLGSGALGSHRGLPVTAIITMSLQQLEESTGIVTTASGGLVPIKDALRMAEQAHPVLVLFDHNGRPLHLGRTKRLASADQRLALFAASRGCTRPGCDAPATMTAVHHVDEWKNNGQTNIDTLDLACDCCHALIKDGPGGWKTRVAPPDSENPGRTEWIAPAHIDPERRPRVNHRHHLDDMIAEALRNDQARKDAEWRDRHRKGERRGGGSRGDDMSAANDDEAP